MSLERNNLQPLNRMVEIMSYAELVIIVEPDHGRRKILSLLVRAASPVTVYEFESFDEARASLKVEAPRIVLCPWADGGGDLLAERIIYDDTEATRPHLILLTPDVTPGKIAVARQAGRTELIPSDPLNLNALRNRIVLCLEGPGALAARLSRSNTALRNALASMPGLRKRLAA